MMLNNILLAAIEVQPIEPSRIIDAAQGAGQGAVVAGWFYGLDFNGGQKDIIEHH